MQSTVAAAADLVDNATDNLVGAERLAVEALDDRRFAVGEGCLVEGGTAQDCATRLLRTHDNGQGLNRGRGVY